MTLWQALKLWWRQDEIDAVLKLAHDFRETIRLSTEQARRQESAIAQAYQAAIRADQAAMKEVIRSSRTAVAIAQAQSDRVASRIVAQSTAADWETAAEEAPEPTTGEATDDDSLEPWTYDFTDPEELPDIPETELVGRFPWATVSRPPDAPDAPDDASPKESS
jgi:hypothetical protein